MRAIVLVVICVACRRDHPCEKFVDLAEKCKPELPSATLQEMQLMCSIDVRDKQTTAFAECSKATTCAEQSACLATWDCRLVFTSPTDREPQMMCRLTPP